MGVINSVSVMAQYMQLQCGKPVPDAFPEADPPALPLNLESGGLELDVLTALGTIQVDTTNARGLEFDVLTTVDAIQVATTNASAGLVAGPPPRRP